VYIPPIQDARGNLVPAKYLFWAANAEHSYQGTCLFTLPAQSCLRQGTASPSYCTLNKSVVFGSMANKTAAAPVDYSRILSNPHAILDKMRSNGNEDLDVLHPGEASDWELSAFMDQVEDAENDTGSNKRLCLEAAPMAGAGLRQEGGGRVGSDDECSGEMP
jgi:hypothetical protein